MEFGDAAAIFLGNSPSWIRVASVVGIGDFIGWDGGCLLIGKALRVVPHHSHQAIQVVFGYTGSIGLRGGDEGEWTQYPLGVIPSRQPHSMDATRSTYNVIIFVEPETPAGRALTERHLRHGIASVDEADVRQASSELFAQWLSRAGQPELIAGACGLAHPPQQGSQDAAAGSAAAGLAAQPGRGPQARLQPGEREGPGQRDGEDGLQRQLRAAARA
jgi:hypothetical protein